MRRAHRRPGGTPALVVLLLGAVLTLAAASPSAQAAAAPTAAAASTCTVPNVIGNQVGGAMILIRWVGFADVFYWEDGDVAHDEVTSVWPAVGSRVSCNTTVEIHGRPCYTSVPLVEDTSIKFAMDTISRFRLVPHVNYPPGGSYADYVLSQNPKAGWPVKCFTTVYLTPGPADTDPR